MARQGGGGSVVSRGLKPQSSASAFRLPLAEIDVAELEGSSTVTKPTPSERVCTIERKPTIKG